MPPMGEPFPIQEWAAEEGADDETIRERLYRETDPGPNVCSVALLTPA